MTLVMCLFTIPLAAIFIILGILSYKHKIDLHANLEDIISNEADKKEKPNKYKRSAIYCFIFAFLMVAIPIIASFFPPNTY